MATQPYNRTLGRLRLVLVFVFVGVILAFARPGPGSLTLGLPLLALGEGIRIWAAGHLIKTDALITSGPYRHSRNPLYLGRLLILSGLCLMAPLAFALHLLALVVGCAVFFGYYLPRKERVEPARLLAAHGAAYARYRDAVPALWPALRPYPDGSRERWSSRKMLRNREHWMALVLTLVTLFLAWRAF